MLGLYVKAAAAVVVVVGGGVIRATSSYAVAAASLSAPLAFSAMTGTFKGEEGLWSACHASETTARGGVGGP